MNRLPIVKHLALYTAFHQDHRNLLVHQLASPLVYFSAMLGLQVLVPALVLPLLIASVAMLALADWKGAAVFGLGLVAEWAASVWLSHQLSSLWLLLLAAVVQGGAWAALIFIGHNLFEPHLEVEGQPASKGLYFERHYNFAQGLGAKVNLYDRVLQFSIAPLAHSNELLFALGLRKDFELRVSAERARVVEQLNEGRAPFAATSDTAQRPPSACSGSPRWRGEPRPQTRRQRSHHRGGGGRLVIGREPGHHRRGARGAARNSWYRRGASSKGV